MGRLMNKELTDRVYCPFCHNLIHDRELVYLDSIMTLTHVQCGRDPNLPLRDRGEYINIIEKYNF